MNDDQKNDTNQAKAAPKKGLGVVWIIVIILIVISLAFFAYRLFIADNSITPDDKTAENTAATKTADLAGNPEYQKLVGTWETDCLVPDPASNWAEKHQFVFDSQGSATHQRQSGDNCANIKKDDTTQKYTVEIPQIGKINLIGADEDSESVYDVFKIENSVLYFGHGFRDKYPADMINFGATAETRYDSFNTFLAYKKLP